MKLIITATYLVDVDPADFGEEEDTLVEFLQGNPTELVTLLSYCEEADELSVRAE